MNNYTITDGCGCGKKSTRQLRTNPQVTKPTPQPNPQPQHPQPITPPPPQPSTGNGYQGQ